MFSISFLVSLIIFRWNKDDNSLVEFQNHKCIYSNTFSKYSKSLIKPQNSTISEWKGPLRDHPEGDVNTDDATSSNIRDKKP